MIIEISYYLLIWVLIINFISLLIKKWDDIWFYLILSIVTIVIIQLFISFINNDFCLQIIRENSQIEEPFLYKIAALWSNNEGSLLMCYWLLLILLLNYKYKFDYFIIKIISFVLIIIINLSINPLIREKDFYLEVGSRLNPLLEDPVMIIHPPIIFTGYGLIVLLMISKYYNLELKYILLKSFGIISLGIGLGSWWAYYELGWGGFWFWDPIENLALLPWIIIIGLIHIIYMKDENIERRIRKSLGTNAQEAFSHGMKWGDCVPILLIIERIFTPIYIVCFLINQSIKLLCSLGIKPGASKILLFCDRSH